MGGYYGDSGGGRRKSKVTPIVDLPNEPDHHYQTLNQRTMGKDRKDSGIRIDEVCIWYQVGTCCPES